MRRILAIVLVTLTATVTLGVTSTAHAADTGAESDFVNRINGLRASKGLGGLGVHSVLTAKAEAWAQHMADSGCLCHSNLPDGVTVGWRKLGENIGRGGSVASLHDALVASPLHYANMVDPAFHWIGVGVAYGNGQMYVAEVFMDGDPPPQPSPLLAFDSRGQAIAARAQGGFWVMQGDGTVHAYEGAPAYGSPQFPGNFARDIAVMPDGKGYVILDALGGVHRYGSALFTLSGVGGPWFGFNIARSIAVTPSGRGFAVLDGFGGYHPFGDAPRMSDLPYWPGWDIARSIAFNPGGGMYMLDGFGKVWRAGGAPDYGTTFFGWDIARDITPWPDGRGYEVVDGFGGIHPFGSAKRPGNTPWQPVDRWRSLVAQAGTILAVRNDGMPIRV
ncbi:MAG: CAP domain-containing protein [Acidimicrobiia bacterium]